MGYLLLATMAAVGFLTSLACHLMGWLQIEPTWGKSVLVLHLGIFGVWIPLIFFANRTMPKHARGNAEHLFKAMPKWGRTVIGSLFVYTLFNFLYFIYCKRQYPRHEVPFSVELRGASGHWMLFYGVAAMSFAALARLTRKRRKYEPAA